MQKMRCTIALLSLCALTIAAPTEITQDEERKIVEILSSENQVNGYDGKFHYSFESEDGTKAMQRGELKNVDGEHAGEAVVGEFSYQGNDGKTYSLKYTADENGYQPVGDHLPTPPPIPEAIVKALAILATVPPPPQEDNVEQFSK